MVGMTVIGRHDRQGGRAWHSPIACRQRPPIGAWRDRTSFFPGARDGISRGRFGRVRKSLLFWLAPVRIEPPRAVRSEIPAVANLTPVGVLVPTDRGILLGTRAKSCSSPSRCPPCVSDEPCISETAIVENAQFANRRTGNTVSPARARAKHKPRRQVGGHVIQDEQPRHQARRQAAGWPGNLMCTRWQKPGRREGKTKLPIDLARPPAPAVMVRGRWIVPRAPAPQ